MAWLAGVLAANAIGAGINPVVALTGAAVAPVFAAGTRFSPDADLGWLRFLGHRGATHRASTALALTAITGAAWLVVGRHLPLGAGWLVWAPVVGWWSHLAADRLWGALGVRTGGVVERGRSRRGRQVLPFAPATVAFRGVAAVLAVAVTVQWATF